VFVAGFLLPPVFERAGRPGAEWLRAVYAPLCHQLAARSFEISGAPLAVCARCAGLYGAGALGLLVAALTIAGRRRGLPRWLFFAAVAPTAVDAVLPWIGLQGSNEVQRFLLALPAGFVAALFLAIGVADLFAQNRSASPPGPLPARNSLEVVDG
jgi:uncharacterized membrane protein